MKNGFVRTENYMRFAAGIDAEERRGAKEAGMMLVYGQPGYGKSTIVYNWAAEANALFLRANQDWTPLQMQLELAKLLRVDANRNGLFARLLERIVEEQRPIVIDEAEFTLRDKAAVLEKVRDFSDRAEVSVVLIGMSTIQERISRHKQISSRIAQVVEFTPATLGDVSLACAKLCEYAMSRELMAEVHRLSQGRMRTVLNIIAEIERLAKANDITGELDVEHFVGAALVHDWQNGTGRGVRRAAA